MIDLKNTYIENDKGELRDLYVTECGKQGIFWYKENEPCDHDETVIFVGLDGTIDAHSKLNNSYTAAYKQVTMADLKPRTKVGYTKVTDSIFHLKPDFKAGELYRLSHDRYVKVDDELSLAKAYSDCHIYRKVETEITWQDEADDFVDNCKSLDTTDHLSDLIWMKNGDASTKEQQLEFISLCHLVASMTDKPSN